MFQHITALYFFEHHVFVLLYFFAIFHICVSMNGCSLKKAIEKSKYVVFNMIIVYMCVHFYWCVSLCLHCSVVYICICIV